MNSIRNRMLARITRSAVLMLLAVTLATSLGACVYGDGGRWHDEGYGHGGGRHWEEHGGGERR